MRKPIESRLRISLPDLKKRGYLGCNRSGTITWQLDDQVLASVNVHVRLLSHEEVSSGALTITYLQQGASIEQVIGLVRVSSNLGRGGGIWYFLCPVTGERCRTLIDGVNGFASRHAEGGLRYRAQLYPQLERTFQASLSALREQERLLHAMEWLTRPHSKRSYKGKLTRPMVRFRKLSGISE